MKFFLLVDILLILYLSIISLSFNYKEENKLDYIHNYNTFFKKNKFLTNNYLIKKIIILLILNYIILIFLLNYTIYFVKI